MYVALVLVDHSCILFPLQDAVKFTTKNVPQLIPFHAVLTAAFVVLLSTAYVGLTHPVPEAVEP